jgi:hypothetical protein
VWRRPRSPSCPGRLRQAALPASESGALARRATRRLRARSSAGHARALPRATRAARRSAVQRIPLPRIALRCELRISLSAAVSLTLSDWESASTSGVDRGAPAQAARHAGAPFSASRCLASLFAVNFASRSAPQSRSRYRIGKVPQRGVDRGAPAQTARRSTDLIHRSDHLVGALN